MAVHSLVTGHSQYNWLDYLTNTELNLKQVVKTYRVRIDYCRFKAYQRQKELLFLYGPIVGPKALNLYGHLLMQGGWSADARAQSSKIDFSLLLMTMHCHQTEFNQMRCLLEAMNLLVTVLEGNNYIFYLQPPLEAELFFINRQYMLLLQDKKPNFKSDQMEVNFGLKVSAGIMRRQNISVTFNYLQTSVADTTKNNTVQFQTLDQQLTTFNLNPCSYWPFRTRIKKILHFFNLHPRLLFDFIKNSYCMIDNKFSFAQFEQQVNNYVRQNQDPLPIALSKGLGAG